MKAYNLIEMVSFVIDTMEMYYQRRLIHLANNRIDHFISLCFCGLNSSIIPLQAIKRGDSDTFYFQSQHIQEEVYVVDMHIGACTCKGGVDGSPCSHQAAVSKHIASLTFMLGDIKEGIVTELNCPNLISSEATRTC